MRRYASLFLIGVIFMILAYFIHLKIMEFKTYERISLPQKKEYEEYKLYYETLESFFEEHFMTDGYVITNLSTDKPLEEDLPSSNDVLSESMGLLLEKYLKDNDKANFDDTFEKLKGYFIKQNNLIAWKIPVEELVKENTNIKEGIVNASIDDFRIAKIMFKAYEKFGDQEYKLEGIKLGNALKKYCIKDRKLLSYDGYNSPKAIWTYYDFEAMYYLSKHDDYWNGFISENLRNVRNHQVEGKPFFYIESIDEKYKSIENLIIIMHLAQVGIVDTTAIQFIRDELKNGGYYGEYSANGQRLNDIESPAIYGIIAQIAKFIDDYELYSLACKKLVLMSNTKDGKYYGGYIDEDRMKSYSFDQLMALLGY